MSDQEEVNPLPPYKLLGKHVQPFRKKLKYTQEQFGDYLGVTRQTINTRENLTNQNSILPDKEQRLLWALMTTHQYDPWHETSTLINVEGSDAMTRDENKNTYSDFTQNMEGFEDAYLKLSKFFDTLVEHTANKIDRACLINVSNPSRSPSDSIMCASTSHNSGREIGDKMLLAAVQEVLLKESNESEKDNETSFEIGEGLYFPARLDDNEKQKMVFLSADNKPLVFEGAIAANYITIGVKFREALRSLGINIG